MSEKSKARTLRRKNQRDKKKFSSFLTKEPIREKDMKDLFLNSQRKLLEHKPKQEMGGAIPPTLT